jgi:hypothetical protein
VTRLTRAFLIALSIAAFGLLQASASENGDQATAPADASKVHVVAAGDFVLHVEREGRIDSADKTKVRIIPETFGGPFEVAEVLKRNGRVKQGEVLLKIDSEAFDKEMDSARMALDHARKRLEIAREEARIQKEDNATRMSRSKRRASRRRKNCRSGRSTTGPTCSRARN